MEKIISIDVNNIIRGEARDTLSLDGIWQLRLDPNERGAREAWYTGYENFEYSVVVPGCVQAVKEIAQVYPSWTVQNGYQGDCWYQHRFTVPNDWAGRHIWLKFGGIMPAGHIWLNGAYLGYHNQSQVAVKFDATKVVHFGDQNILTVELPWRDVGLRGGLTFGSGLYRSVELETTGAIHIEDMFVRPNIEEISSTISAIIYNDSEERQKLTVQALIYPVDQRQYDSKEALYSAMLENIEVSAKNSTPISMQINMPKAQYWSPDAPNLYVLLLKVLNRGDVLDDAVQRFGMRRMAISKDCITLNDRPIMLRFVSDEFAFCPTISPIVDRDLIRHRIEILKKLGFNGKRYHTHVPTAEELDVCDELGFLVHAEISVISNFNKTEPYPACRETWQAKLKEIRNHPSLVIYCMGNEGSQIMEGKYELAKQYYDDAKKLMPEVIVLAASGSQGEHPVPNDFETPHLWSNNFRWAYDGLSAVPWGELDHIMQKGPIVIHEYSKMTVWPDPEEDVFFVEGNMPLKGNYGTMGKMALKQAGIDHLLQKVVRNSRKLAAICQKVVLEEARKQPGVSGYHIHSAFRVGCNRGMADDLGRRIDPEFADYHLSNAPTALLIDRGFRGRTMMTGEPISIDIYLSHFNVDDIDNGEVQWRLIKDEMPIYTGKIDDIRFKCGKNGPIGKIRFIAPEGLGKLTLEAVLLDNGRIMAQNYWCFWSFPHSTHYMPEGMLSHASDARWEYNLMADFPRLYRLHDAMTIRYGVMARGEYNTPRDHIHNREKTKYIDDYLMEYPPTAVIADNWDTELKSYVEKGGTVILLDTGHFPKTWYAPVVDNSAKYDVFAMYTPFRSGWDHGNAATIFENHPMLGDFPHEGFADLHCFAMIQGSKTLCTKELPGEIMPVLRVVPIWKTEGPQSGPAPEAPDVPRRWATENRVYIAESKFGSGRLIICSLNLTADPAGHYLLEKLIQYAGLAQFK